MGAAGVNPQLPNKPGLANSLSPFPADIKSTPVTSVPNMVSWTAASSILYLFLVLSEFLGVAASATLPNYFSTVI